MNMGLITISDGNCKLGVVPSFSVPPVTTCIHNAPCVKNCYANRYYKRYPTVRTAYEKNKVAIDTLPVQTIDLLDSYINMAKPKYFRFNVAGDVYSMLYMHIIHVVATHNSNTQFLLYTKQYDVINEYTKHNIKPHNLTIVFSTWYNDIEVNNPHRYPLANICNSYTGIEINAQCSGKCYDCNYKCWYLKPNEVIYFKQH